MVQHASILQQHSTSSGACGSKYTRPAGIYVAAATAKQLSTRSGIRTAGMYVASRMQQQSCLKKFIVLVCMSDVEASVE